MSTEASFLLLVWLGMKVWVYKIENNKKTISILQRLKSLARSKFKESDMRQFLSCYWKHTYIGNSSYLHTPILSKLLSWNNLVSHLEDRGMISLLPLAPQLTKYYFSKELSTKTTNINRKHQLLNQQRNIHICIKIIFVTTPLRTKS